MTIPIQFRPYQQLAEDQVYNEFRRGIKRVILHMQTGGGKSIVYSKLIHDHYMLGIPCVLAVKRRELIKQASKHLDKWKIPHGVYMADHRRYRPNELVQICSIDTLAARSLYPHSDKSVVFVSIDECHDCSPTSQKYRDFMEHYRHAYIVGYSATPYRDNSLFESIVCPIQAYELRDQGYLVPEWTWVPSLIDTSSVSITKTGEFNERELFEASSRKEIVGDFVRDWHLYGQGRPTILFAVNVAHSKLICKAYNDAGISSLHSDASTTSSERDRAIARLVRGQVQVLCNVDIFSTGIDIPEASCIQICRPSQSLVWHLQAIGRGLRTSQHTGKTDCMVIDNAGNTLRHGPAYMPRDASITPYEQRPKSIGDEISIRSCKRCHFVFDANIHQCPACGYINPPVERKINQVEGELTKYQMNDEELALMNKKMLFNEFHKLCWVAYRNDKLPWKWVYDQLGKKYGVDMVSTHRHNLEIPEKFTKRRA